MGEQARRQALGAVQPTIECRDAAEPHETIYYRIGPDLRSVECKQGRWGPFVARAHERAERQAPPKAEAPKKRERKRASRTVPPDTLAPVLMLILQLQGHRCYLCGTDFGGATKPTRDHVMPKAHGGKDAGNILFACAPCNNQKADRLPTDSETRYLMAIKARFAAVMNAHARA